MRSCCPAQAGSSASPPHRALGADGAGISVSAPSTVGVGAAFAYTITVTYGDLAGESAPYTVTDALPAGLVYQSVGITAGTCTTPADGQNGTVSCVMKFAPASKSSTITITVRSTQTGTVTNTVSLSNGDTTSAATTIAPLPSGGSADVSVSGPDTIMISQTVAPPRFPYTLTFTYAGPALTSTARITFSDDLPGLVGSPGLNSPEGIFDCTYPDKTAPGGRLSCTVEFTESRRTVMATVSVRPTGRTGVGTSTVTLSTGATASTSTTFVHEPAPPPPDPPTPVAGPAAAPTKTVVETFAAAGQAEPQQAPVSASAETAQVALTWNDAGSSFDVTGVQRRPRARSRRSTRRS